MILEEFLNFTKPCCPICNQDLVLRSECSKVVAQKLDDTSLDFYTTNKKEPVFAIFRNENKIDYYEDKVYIRGINLKLSCSGAIDKGYHSYYRDCYIKINKDDTTDINIGIEFFIIDKFSFINDYVMNKSHMQIYSKINFTKQDQVNKIDMPFKKISSFNFSDNEALIKKLNSFIVMS